MNQFEARFGVVEDVHDWPDPWGMGILFGLLRWDSRENQEALKEEQKGNLLLRRTLANYTIAELEEAEKSAKSEEEAEPPAAEAEASAETAAKQAAADKSRSARWFAARRQAMSEVIEKKEMDVLEILGGSPDQWRRQAKRLFKRWSGYTDADGIAIAISEAEVDKLLSQEQQIPEGEIYAGLTVGEALCRWAIERSKAAETYRQKYLERAEKNSEPSSVGA